MSDRQGSGKDTAEKSVCPSPLPVACHAARDASHPGRWRNARAAGVASAAGTSRQGRRAHVPGPAPCPASGPPARLPPSVPFVCPRPMGMPGRVVGTRRMCENTRRRVPCLSVGVASPGGRSAGVGGLTPLRAQAAWWGLWDRLHHPPPLPHLQCHGLSVPPDVQAGGPA